MSITENPDYKLVTSKSPIEIRDYPPLIFAEVEVEGERKEAINEGFKMLADYIFGNNTSKKSRDVTAGPTDRMSEKIAMTAPVVQEKLIDKWRVKFMMPKKYSLETLPQPNSEKIHLIESPAKRFAVIQFSGIANDESLQRHTDELKAYISAEKLIPIGEVVFAFYNPPWTPPFLRRNEIMIEIGMSNQ